MNTRSKWFLLPMSLVTAGLVFAAACGGDDDGDETPTGGTTPGATAAATEPTGDKAPADQQKITIQLGEPQFLDPHRSSFEQDIGVERMLFRGLYNLTDDGAGGVKVEPMMAESEPQVRAISSTGGRLAAPSAQEPTVYTVKLKSGLMWSDGEPLTAQHFADGAKRGCDPAVAADYGYLWGPGYLDMVGCAELQANEDEAQKQALMDALGVRAVDDTTIEYTLNQTNDRFTMIMALWVTFPARLDVIEANGDAWTQPGNIVSNGPYMLTAYTAGESLVLEPNPNWTAGPTPALQEITIRFIDDLSQAFRAYQSGELQVTRINASDIAVASADSDLADEVLINPSGRITTLQVQMENEVLSDPNVRLALSRAIDREELNEVVFDGTNTPATYWVVKGLAGHQGNEAFDSIIGFDEAAAKAALAEAGYADGAGFPELSIVVHTPDFIRTAEYLQEQFKTILGIDITIDQVDSPTRSARFREETFELFIGGWQIDYPDIENVLFGLFETDGGNNHYNCSNPDVDAALQTALSAADDDARVAAYEDMETAIVTNLCGVIPMWQDSLPFMVSSQLGGVVANGTIDAGQPGNYCIECWYVKAD